MTTLIYLLTWTPSSRTVEKVFAVLSDWAPESSSIWNILNTMALLAPQPSMVWMFPMVALSIAIVHALITRQVDMMLGAALLLLFYTAGHLLLPTIDVPNQTQLNLIILLHTWFSCVASYILLGCMGCSLVKHFIAIAWTYRKESIRLREFERSREKKMPVKKRKPISRPSVASISSGNPEEMPNHTTNVKAFQPDTSF